MNMSGFRAPAITRSYFGRPILGGLVYWRLVDRVKCVKCVKCGVNCVKSGVNDYCQINVTSIRPLGVCKTTVIF